MGGEAAGASRSCRRAPDSGIWAAEGENGQRALINILLLREKKESTDVNPEKISVGTDWQIDLIGPLDEHLDGGLVPKKEI